LSELRENLARLPSAEDLERLTHELAELRKGLCSAYDLADKDEKRILVDSIWPNRQVIGKSVVLEPSDWLREALAGKPIPVGDPEWGHGRTFATILEVLKRAQDPSARSGKAEAMDAHLFSDSMSGWDDLSQAA